MSLETYYPSYDENSRTINWGQNSEQLTTKPPKKQQGKKIFGNFFRTKLGDLRAEDKRLEKNITELFDKHLSELTFNSAERAGNKIREIKQEIVKRYKENYRIIGGLLAWQAKKRFDPLIKKTKKQQLAAKNASENLLSLLAKGNSPSIATKIIELLRQGADPNTSDAAGKTPLHYACEMDSLAAVEALIQAKADINAMDNEDHSPLHYACMRGRRDVVDKLLQAGAIVDPTDSMAPTPLIYAIQNKQLEIIKKLLQHGAKTDLKDPFDQTPLDYVEGNSPLDQVIRNLLQQNTYPKN